ncbi:MAG: hypothetical protein AB7L66_00400 [Gemmatimonadales bacterium]
MTRLAAMAGLGLAAACSDGTGPNQNSFDAAKVEAGLAVVEQATTAPVIRSFGALGASISGSQAPSATGPDRLVSAVRTLAGIVRPEVNAAFVPVIGGDVLGQTYVYHQASGTYVVDPARTGAPANGVRFILYQLDANDHPTSTEAGYADLIDAQSSSSSSAGLTLRVVSGGITYLEYAFALSGSVANATVAVDGFISNGTEQVDFDITTNGQLFWQGGPASIDAHLEVPSKDFAVTVALAGTAGSQSGDGSYDLKVTSGADVLVLEADVAAGVVDASVTYNGSLFATITGPVGSPTVAGENGRELTNAEMAVLGHVVAFAGGVLEVFGGLLEPVGVLLLIGLGL